MNGKKEYGDYQTPADFAQNICRYIKDSLRIVPSVVLEPTCGKGSFLQGSLIFPNARIIGIELNEKYCDYCNETVTGKRITVFNKNILGLPTKPLVGKTDKLLIIGNPPWITNAGLSVLNSDNVPKKYNIKNTKGLDAMTGSANFDICESIMVQLIEEYKQSDTTIALICKTSVARNVFEYLHKNRIDFLLCEMLTFNAKEVFAVNTDACVFIVTLSTEKAGQTECAVKPFGNPQGTASVLRFKNNFLYNGGSESAAQYDGHCCFEWRQGVKHDCSKVMELSLVGNQFVNGNKEIVDIEPDIVFPLIKSSMFKSPIISASQKFVIMTQRKIGQDTSYIKNTLPKTWNYLQQNEALFSARKSSIYKNAAPFSMFGVGDYSFAPYKVGISGFYKTPFFSILTSEQHKPLMTDDTTYFLSFERYEQAYIVMLLLNDESVRRFLAGISFADSKRPFTKKVLERLDFSKMTKQISISNLQGTERKLRLNPFCSLQMYDNFKSCLPMELF